MDSTLGRAAAAFAKEQGGALEALLEALCRIPAPSLHEELRAEFVLQWLLDNRAEGAFVDEALNVVFPYGCEEGKELVVFCAHTDTVFPDRSPMACTVADGRMYCPGVGDNTANLAALMTIVKFICRERPVSPYGMLFVANAGEEGLGNLKGIRRIMEVYGGRVREVVSFDGGYEAVCDRAVGSRRYRIRVATEGGHSYGDFGNRNAIHCLGAIIGELYRMPVPDAGGAKSTFNVGTISGGTSVNTIAQSAEALFELRSDSGEALEAMRDYFDRVVARFRAEGLDLSVELLGLRPGMGPVDPAAQRELAGRALEAIRLGLGIAADTRPSSTDCNIPLSMGIPAVCFGLRAGEGAHTREEWVALDSLVPGLGVGLRFVLDYFERC